MSALDCSTLAVGQHVSQYLHLHLLCHLRLELLFAWLKHGASLANALIGQRGAKELVGHVKLRSSGRFAMHTLHLNKKQTGLAQVGRDTR